MRVRTALWLAVIAGAFNVFAGSTETFAQIPATPDDFKAILGDVATTAQGIAAAEKSRKRLEPRIKSWQGRNTQHNANPCTYPPGHPEACAAYNAEATALDKERDGLRAELKTSDETLGTLRSHYNLQLSRLRLAKFLGALEQWRDRVVACANLPSAEAAAACLKSAWEAYP